MCFGRLGVWDPVELGDFVGVAKERIVPDHARQNRANRQHTQRDQHGQRAFMGVVMGVLIAARCAIKGQKHQAPRIKRGHCRSQHQKPETIVRSTGKSAFDDRILGQEAGKTDMGQRNTNTRDRQSAYHHGGECIGNLFAQTTVMGHVLFMVHCVYDRSRTQKQHRLEKRMGEQMKHGG